jgi:LEA14-like dessication related protein
MITSGFSIGKVFKWIVVLFLTAALGIAIYFLLNDRKAVQLAFPDLEDIYFVNAVIKHDSAHTKLSIVLQNKNFYSLNIDTLYFNIKLNDTSIARQVVPLHIRQTPFKKDTVRVPLDLSIEKIGGLLKHLENEDSTVAEASGYVIYQTFLGRKKLEFEKRSKIIVPIPPQIRLVHLTREKFNFKTKILRTHALIEIKNPGKVIDLHLSNLTYELNINDELHTKDKFERVVHVKPQTTITLNVPMNIVVDHPLKTKLLIMSNRDRLPYTLVVNGIVKEHISDKEYSSPLRLTVSGYMELEK